MVLIVKVCGIIGSPKKKGNVDILVSQILKGSETQGFQTQKIYLNDLCIKPCQSCGTNAHSKYCLFDDDMHVVYKAMDSCKGIVLGSPIYFDTVSAQTKLMIDRCNCLMPYVEQSDGTFRFERKMKNRKKGVFVAVAGTEQEFDTVQNTIRGFFNWTNTELTETFFYRHDDNQLGAVKANEKVMKQAMNIGIRLATLILKASH